MPAGLRTRSARSTCPARGKPLQLDAGAFFKKGVFYVKALIKKFWADEKGLETIEYAIMIALIVAGLIAVVGAIGTWVLGQFEGLQTELTA